MAIGSETLRIGLLQPCVLISTMPIGALYGKTGYPAIEHRPRNLVGPINAETRIVLPGFLSGALRTKIRRSNWSRLFNRGEDLRAPWFAQPAHLPSHFPESLTQTGGGWPLNVWSCLLAWDWPNARWHPAGQSVLLNTPPGAWRAGWPQIALPGFLPEVPRTKIRRSNWSRLFNRGEDLRTPRLTRPAHLPSHFPESLTQTGGGGG